MSIVITLVSFALRLAFRNKQEALVLLVVYFIIGSLFPLAMGPEKDALHMMGVAVIWVAAFLAAMLSLPRVFEEDYRDGMLEQLLLLPSLPHFIVIAKMVAHWLAICVPLLLASPLLGIMYGFHWGNIGIILVTLTAGTLIISAIITLAAALTIGSGKGSMIGVLLVLPLCLPVLIYGAGVSQLAMQGTIENQFYSGILGLVIIALIMMPLAVWAGTMALRLAVSGK